MLARILGRAGEANELRAVDAVPGDDAVTASLPLGHGAGLVEHDRRDPPRLLEDLRPSDQDPELCAAPRPDHQRGRRREAERARAGDDQHGDGRGERRRGVAREQEPAHQGGQREGDHDRDEDGRDAVDEPLHRRLPRLRLRDETGDLRQGGIAADPGRPDDQPAGDVDRGAGDGGALPHLDRYGLAGQHRLVDGRLAGFDDPVGRDLLSGAHDEAVTDGQIGDGHEHLGAVPQDVHVLRAELEQRADRLARASRGARLEQAPEQDQRRDHGGSLEVRVRIEPGEQHHRRPPPGGERADRDQRVHRRRAVTRRLEGDAMEGPARPEDDRRRERERDPLPAGELEGHHHREQSDRQAQHGCDDETEPQRTRLVAGVRVLGLRRRRVAGGLDRAHELGDRHDAGSKRTAAWSVARLTVASTPSSPFRLRSMRAAHEAQVIPSRSRRICSVGWVSAAVIGYTPIGYQRRLCWATPGAAPR